MIELNTGRPGAGKTYRAVYRLVVGDVGKKYTVFHNIPDLKSSLVGDGEHCHYWPDIPGFLTFDKQKEICAYESDRNGRPVLVIIDEAQTFLGEKNPELRKWLSWHRHNGQDVWLICQHYKMIHGDFYNLCEFEVRGKKGSLVGMFLYTYLVGGERWKSEKLKTSKVVFGAYKSFDQGETSKKRSKLPWMALGAGVLCIGAVVFLVTKALPSGFAKAGASQPSKQRVHSEAPKKGGKVAPVAAKGGNAAPAQRDEIRYSGVMGGRVLVQNVEGGGVSLLEDRPGFEHYAVLEAGARAATVMLMPGGERVIIRAKSVKGVAPNRPPGEQAQPGGL